MSKPNTKKMFTVMITVAMVFSALAILSFAAQPAYAASGTFTVNPTTYTVGTSGGVTTIAYAAGGTFGSGSTVYFFLSSTTSSSGIVSSSGTTINSVSNTLGDVALAAGTTTLANSVTFTMKAGAVAGSYYILAEDYISGSPSGTYALGPAVTVVSYAPTVTVNSGSAVNVAQSVKVTGTAFDAGASISVYLNYPGSSVTLGTTTADASGAISFYVTIPALSGTEDSAGNSITGVNAYNVVAQETNAYSSTSYPEGGITADTTMNVEPTVTVSPASIAGASGTTVTVTGAGFVSGQTMSASSSSVSSTSIEIGTVLTYHSAVTVASDGSFSVSATLSGNVWTSSTDGSGGLAVVITPANPAVTSDSFADAIYSSIPNPLHLGLSETITPTAVSTQNSPNDPISVTVWNYPAGTTVAVYLGFAEIGTFTTDSNGYGTLASTAVVPALPAATYNLYANTSAGLLKSITGVVIGSYFEVTDPSGAVMDTSAAEYFPSYGNYTVSAYGLNPSSTYTWSDAQASSSATQTVSVGTLNSDGSFSSVGNGTLIFVESPAYTSTTTGTTSALSLGSIAAGYTSGTFEYLVIGSISFTYPAYLSNDGAGTTSLSLLASGLIPKSSTVYPLNGITYNYNAYIGSTEIALTISSVSSTTFASTSSSSGSGTVSGSYTNPTLTSGIYNFSIVYSTQSVSLAVGMQPVVISASGSSLSTGSIVFYENSAQTFYDIVGYGFDSAATVTAYYMTSSGLQTASVGTFAHGAFVTGDTTVAVPPSDIAGTYSAFAVATLGSSSYTAYTSYTITASLTLGATSGSVGNSITGSTAAGLAPGAYYDLYFGSTLLKTLGPSSSTGSLSSFSFSVPTVPAGKYKVTLDPTGTTKVAATGKTFTVKANSAITLGTSSQYAFPGQLVTFSVTGFSSPSNFVSFYNAQNILYFANVAFNGTVIATVPASLSSGGTLSGSFLNPNNAAGSYYKLTITGYEQVSGLTSTGSSISGGSMVQVNLNGAQSDFFGLVSGNGALLTGITSSEIATIEADINSTVSTSLTVPISQLNAAITSINGAVATLKTTVGNITTDLSTINATVSSIESGQVTVLTDLGSISTSLASLNASLVAFNNNVVTINTTLGQVVTSLGSIQTQVTANGNGIATVKTDIGTVQGQIVSQNGNVSQIRTSLGTLTANVSNVSKVTTGISTLEIFLIVIIVLVLITLVISFLAVNAANKAARRVTEEKKQ